MRFRRVFDELPADDLNASSYEVALKDSNNCERNLARKHHPENPSTPSGLASADIRRHPPTCPMTPSRTRSQMLQEWCRSTVFEDQKGLEPHPLELAGRPPGPDRRSFGIASREAADSTDITIRIHPRNGCNIRRKKYAPRFSDLRHHRCQPSAVRCSSVRRSRSLASPRLKADLTVPNGDSNCSATSRSVKPCR